MLWQLDSRMREETLRNIRQEVTAERLGLHLSDLDLCLRKTVLRKRHLAPPATDSQCMLFITGRAFQSYLFPEEAKPVMVDGIICSADALQNRYIEVKSTRQSSKRFKPEEMEHWNRRILGYCKAYGVLEYGLTVLFICGNYAPPFPDLQCWKGTTTVEEVEDNWQDILMRKRVVEQALQDEVLPGYEWTASWEGEQCECYQMCDCPGARKRKLKEGL